MPWLLLAFALVCGCAGTAPPPADWLAWKSRRLESVAGTNGWTTLIGLHWLEEGTNTAGSATTQDIVVAAPRVPKTIGKFIRRGDAVRFVVAPDILVRSGDIPVTDISLITDRDPSPTVLEVGAARMQVIARGDRLGVRIRSPEAPARRQFRGLQCFPYDPAWRIPARFEPYPTARTVRLPSVIGIPQEYVSPGRVLFPHAGREYALEAVIELGESEYFILFRDATAGSDTYASGRFLYVSQPDASGRTVVDFNRAYTPPCGFTAFATCPLPPPQNRLPFPIPAGERRPEAHPLDGTHVANP
ncbi:MAG: DUF1684 domain-containing protein [Verrucomicrobia bacterium]|nr:DUF1684 domain-containing protein [Verrucomicrobiota bacterium]